MATGTMTFTGLKIGIQPAPVFPEFWGNVEISFQGPISTGTERTHTSLFRTSRSLWGFCTFESMSFVRETTVTLTLSLQGTLRELRGHC